MDNFQNWTPKKDVMEMGTITGNGSAISSLVNLYT